MFEKKEVEIVITAEEFGAFITAIMTEVGIFGHKFTFDVKRGDGYVISIAGITDEVDSFLKDFEIAKRGYSIAL